MLRRIKTLRWLAQRALMLTLTIIFGCILVFYGMWSREVDPHARGSMQMRTHSSSRTCLRTAHSHKLWTTTEVDGSGWKQKRQKQPKRNWFHLRIPPPFRTRVTGTGSPHRRSGPIDADQNAQQEWAAMSWENSGGDKGVQDDASPAIHRPLSV